MKIAFLGDSITQGSGASSIEKCYVSQVKEILNSEVINYGIGGTRIARQKAPSIEHRHDIDFNLRTILLDKSADKLFVFGGTNDYGHGDAEFGKVGDNDVFTFHGAVNNLFTTLINDFGKEKLVVILPLKRANMDSKKNPTTSKLLKDYVEVIKYYVDLFGLKYIDLFNNGFDMPPEGESEYFADGLHPNDKGHRVLAEKICEFLKTEQN